MDGHNMQDRNPPPNSASDSAPEMGATGDTMSILKAIRDMHSDMTARFTSVDSAISLLQQENDRLKTEVSVLKARVDMLENEKRRRCLIFRGLPSSILSTADLDKFFKESLELDIKSEWIWRTKSTATGGVVIVTFRTQVDRNSVLDKMISVKPNGIYAKPDLPLHVRESRRNLSKYYKMALDEGKKVKVQWDKLIVDGIVYKYDAQQDTLIKDADKS
jgi:hypothetical protein